MASSGNSDQTSDIIHASAVSLSGRGLLITGAAGSGKSSLALELMGLGAGLVADDRVSITRDPEGQIWLSPAPNIEGMIEARGIGILAADFAGPCRLHARVDMSVAEPDRLPSWHSCTVLGQPVPLLHNPGKGPFAAGLLQYLKGERVG